MNLLRAIIRRFDGWLSDMEGVAPFTDDPQCILRMQTGRAKHDLILPEGTIPRGADVLLLHAWNERMPPIPDEGADLAYGLEFQRLTVASLRLAARHLREHPALEGVQTIGGVTAHISLERAKGGRAMKVSVRQKPLS